MQQVFSHSFTTGIACQTFSVNNTTQNYASCFFTAHLSGSRSSLVISTLTGDGGSCSGDTYLRLYDADTGVQLASNDDNVDDVWDRASRFMWKLTVIKTWSCSKAAMKIALVVGPPL
jgi:hypothetical protein